MDPLLKVFMAMFAFLGGAAVAMRFVFSLPRRFIPCGRKPPKSIGIDTDQSLMAVLGSGGHTAEMLAILSSS